MISHAIFLVTLPLVIIARGFANLTDDVVEAATMMGATPWLLFKTVVLPLNHTLPDHTALHLWQ